MDSLEKLIPLFLIIIWGLLSYQSGKKKKKRPPNIPEDKREEPDEDRLGKRAVNEKEQRAPGLEFLNDLKSGFDKSQPRTGRPGMAEKMESAERKRREKHEIKEKKREKKIKSDSGKDKQHKKTFEQIVLHSEEKVPRAPAVNEPRSRHVKTKYVREFSVDELRKAIVWSEILAPPVSQRKDR